MLSEPPPLIVPPVAIVRVSPCSRVDSVREIVSDIVIAPVAPRLDPFSDDQTGAAAVEFRVIDRYS